MLRKLILIFISSLPLFAGTHTFILENDFLAGTDKHYTNGFFYTWMSTGNQKTTLEYENPNNSYKSDIAISLSHLTFTPEDLSDPNINTKDIPYAGYINLNFLLYKSKHNFFHEFGVGIGVVGPIAMSEELQKIIHKITGNPYPQGWNNQLETEYMLNTSYQFGYRMDIKKYKYIEFDWTNNVRADLGKFYTGALFGSSIRVGNVLPDNFKTTGNFIGGEESASLNFHRIKGFAWSLSFGVFVNLIDTFYITDSHKEYNIANIDYTRGKVLALNFHYEKFEFSIKMKSTQLNISEDFERIDEDIGNTFKFNEIKKWAGFTFRWSFD